MAKEEEYFNPLDPLGPEFGKINQPIADTKGYTAFEGSRVMLPQPNMPVGNQIAYSNLPKLENLNAPNNQIYDNVVRTNINNPSIPQKAFDINEYNDSLKGYLDNMFQSNQDLNDYARIYSYDAGSTNLSTFYKRYSAYGQEKFDEVGFSPLRDNDANFNARTTRWDDFSRMMSNSFVPLFTQGFTSGFKSFGKILRGDFTSSDREDAEVYETAAAIGQSTKGGIGGFMNNAAMNFSYTAGIITEAIAEETLGAILAAPTGGSSLFTTTVNNARKLPSLLKGVKTGYQGVRQTLNLTKDISGARKVYNAIKESQFLKGTLNQLNPLNNTMGALKQIRQADNFTNLGKIYKTAGGLYRDSRNINMALSEARLEGGMVQNKIYDELYREAYKANGNKVPSDKELAEISKQAEQGGYETLLENVGIIYATNAITFNNITGPRGGLRNFIKSTTDDIYEIASREGSKNFGKIGKVIYNRTSKAFELEANNLKTWAKGWLKNPIHKSVGKTVGYFKANFSEGIQENLQETIAQANEKYFMDSYNSPTLKSMLYSRAAIKGINKGRLDYFSDAWAQQNPFTAQGFETFASGFAMGTMAGPLNSAVPFLSRTYNRMFNKEEYTRWKEAQTTVAQNLVNELNNTNLETFLNGYTQNLGVQERVAATKQKGTKKEALDAETEAYISQVQLLKRTGTFGIFSEKLKDLHNLTDDEFAEAVGIEKDQVNKYRARVDSSIERLNKIKNLYERVERKNPNPINVSDLKEDDPEYQDKLILYHAWETVNRNIVFFNETYDDILHRRSEINKKYNNNKKLKNISNRKRNLLFNPIRPFNETKEAIDGVGVPTGDMLEEINLLEKELALEKETTKNPAKIQMLQEQINLTKDYAEQYRALDIFQRREEYVGLIKEKLKAETGTEYTDEQVLKFMEDEFGAVNDTQKRDELLKNLRNSYTNYLKTHAKQNGQEIFNEDIDETWELMKDYYDLDIEKTKISKYVDVLNDPMAFLEAVRRNNDWLKKVTAKKIEYYEKIIREEMDNIRANALLNALANKGLFISTEDMLNYFADGVPPTEIYDDINKKIYPIGSKEYSQIYQDYFKKYEELKEDLNPNKSEIIDEAYQQQINALEKEKQEKIDALPKEDVETQINNLEGKISLKSLSQEIQNDQYAELKVYQEKGSTNDRDEIEKKLEINGVIPQYGEFREAISTLTEILEDENGNTKRGRKFIGDEEIKAAQEEGVTGETGTMPAASNTSTRTIKIGNKNYKARVELYPDGTATYNISEVDAAGLPLKTLSETEYTEQIDDSITSELETVTVYKDKVGQLRLKNEEGDILDSEDTTQRYSSARIYTIDKVSDPVEIEKITNFYNDKIEEVKEAYVASKENMELEIPYEDVTPESNLDTPDLSEFKEELYNNYQKEYVNKLSPSEKNALLEDEDLNNKTFEEWYSRPENKKYFDEYNNANRPVLSKQETIMNIRGVEVNTNTKTLEQLIAYRDDVNNQITSNNEEINFLDPETEKEQIKKYEEKNKELSLNLKNLNNIISARQFANFPEEIKSAVRSIQKIFKAQSKVEKGVELTEDDEVTGLKKGQKAYRINGKFHRRTTQAIQDVIDETYEYQGQEQVDTIFKQTIAKKGLNPASIKEFVDRLRSLPDTGEAALPGTNDIFFNKLQQELNALPNMTAEQIELERQKNEILTKANKEKNLAKQQALFDQAEEIQNKIDGAYTAPVSTDAKSSIEKLTNRIIPNQKKRLTDAQEIAANGKTFNEAVNNLQKKSENARNRANERLKKEAAEKGVKPLDIQERLYNYEETKEADKYDYLIKQINDIYSEGKQENFNNPTQEAVDFEQKELDKVNNRLATLQSNVPTDAKADIERKSDESVKDFIERLFSNNYFTEIDGKQIFSLTQGRWGVVVNINGIQVPFYQSTSGTDTKVKGQWYPFFGDQGNWVIKGNSDDSNAGYGFKAIQDVQNFLNNNIKETDAIALSDIISKEVLQNQSSLRALDESKIKGNEKISLNKEATAKRLADVAGYSLEEGRKTKSDLELFKLASKKIFAELAALEGGVSTDAKADIERRKRLGQDIISHIWTRLAKQGITNTDSLIGTRETIDNVDFDKFWSNVTKEDLLNLKSSYEANKKEQLYIFKKYGSEENKFIPELGIFLSSDTSFLDNKIKDVDAELAALEGTAQPTTKDNFDTATKKNTTKNIIDTFFAENTYEDSRIAGNFFDLAKDYLESGKKPEFNEEIITREAYDSLIEYLDTIKKRVDSGELYIVGRDLIVYDSDIVHQDGKKDRIAGEIDLILVDKDGIYVVDIKSGETNKFLNFNNLSTTNKKFTKRNEYTLQTAAYATMLEKMIDRKVAGIAMLPIQRESNKKTNQVIEAGKPLSGQFFNELEYKVDEDGKIVINKKIDPKTKKPFNEKQFTITGNKYKFDFLVPLYRESVQEEMDKLFPKKLGELEPGGKRAIANRINNIRERLSEITDELSDINVKNLAIIKVLIGNAVKQNISIPKDIIEQYESKNKNLKQYTSKEKIKSVIDKYKKNLNSSEKNLKEQSDKLRKIKSNVSFDNVDKSIFNEQSDFIKEQLESDSNFKYYFDQHNSFYKNAVDRSPTDNQIVAIETMKESGLLTDTDISDADIKYLSMAEASELIHEGVKRIQYLKTSSVEKSKDFREYQKNIFDLMKATKINSNDVSLVQLFEDAEKISKTGRTKQAIDLLNIKLNNLNSEYNKEFTSDVRKTKILKEILDIEQFKEALIDTYEMPIDIVEQVQESEIVEEFIDEFDTDINVGDIVYSRKKNNNTPYKVKEKTKDSYVLSPPRGKAITVKIDTFADNYITKIEMDSGNITPPTVEVTDTEKEILNKSQGAVNNFLQNQDSKTKAYEKGIKNTPEENRKNLLNKTKDCP